MLHHARVLLLVLAGCGAVGLSNLACSSGVPSEPERKVEVVSPATGLKVTAAIASVSLGDSCLFRVGQAYQRVSKHHLAQPAL